MKVRYQIGMDREKDSNVKLKKLTIVDSEKENGSIFDGPISGKLWNKVNSLNSSYPDTFDWSVYDKLYEKFGENQPRGGVLFKTNLKVANYHHSCSKCHYTFEIDTYGRGCVHNCVYCYAKDQLTLKGYWNRPHPMPLDLSEVRKIFYTVFETNKKSKWREILEQRIPLRIGSMSDSFMLMDRKYKVTHELLKILKFYQYPYVIFTRSDLVAHDEYIDVIDPRIAAVQFSISGNNEELTKMIEPGAPSIKRRFKAIKKLNESGIYSTVRINPLFPSFPDGYFTDFDSVYERFGKDIPRFNLFDIEKAREFMDMMKEAKVKSFLAGVVRLNQTSISQISKATNINYREFFKPENYTNSGESHFSNEEIGYYYRMLSKLGNESGVRFSTCYIGNNFKDYYQYQGLWSNKADCCDIVGRVSGFKKTSQDISWDIRHKHAKDTDISKKVESMEIKLDKEHKEQSLDVRVISNKKMSEEFKTRSMQWDHKKEKLQEQLQD